MKYRMKKDSVIRPDVKAGDEVYSCSKADYGCASDDTRASGIEHMSVTVDPNGDYPFFTVPVRDLEAVE